MGGERYLIFPPVLGGDRTKTSTPGDIFDQTPCERASIWSKSADHVGDQVAMSLGGIVLVTSPGTESSNSPPPQSLNGSCGFHTELAPTT